MDLGSALRLDVRRYGALGLGALSLWSLGRRPAFLGVGAGSNRRAAGLRTGAGRVLRSARRPDRRRAAFRELGGARLGRADRAVVGTPRLRRASTVGWLGRAPRREQRRDQPDDRR